MAVSSAASSNKPSPSPSAGKSKSGGAEATSRAPKTSPRPQARQTSEAPQTDTKDQVSVSREAEQEQPSGSVDSLSRGLAEAFDADPAEAGEEVTAADSADAVNSAEAEQANPYEGFADHSVSVTPEAWTSDRTPAEGQVARNDHLEGILRNQGYSIEDIYKKDESGQSVLDRVVEANNLRDANLITPDQELVVPTLHEPEPEHANQETVSDENVVEGESAQELAAEAGAEVQTGDVVDTEVAAEATAEARNEGSGDATAAAEARAEVASAEDSSITADAEAVAEAAEGRAEATAQAEVDAGEVASSEVAAEATAEARTEGAEEAVAVAEARTEVESAEDSTITAEAEATAQSAEGESTAVAVAENEVGKAEDSEIATEARAEGDTALASATTTVGEAENTEITSQAVAVGEEARAEGEVTVADPGEGVEVDSTVVAEGEDSTALNEVEMGGPAGMGLPGEGMGGVEAVTIAEDDATTRVSGAEAANVLTYSEEGTAAVEVDADTADVTAAGADVRATETGILNENNFTLAADETAYVHDDGAAFAGGNTGNFTNGTVLAQDLDMRLASNGGANIGFVGRDGDNNLSLSGPRDAESATFSAELTDGDDQVTGQMRSEGDVMSFEKTEGSLNFGLNLGRGASSEGETDTFIDAGEAALRGTITGSEYGNDTVMINGGDFQGLNLNAGHGGQDHLIVDLPEGADIPAVFGSGFEGADLGLDGPTDGQQYINARDFESIVFRREGEVVASYGDEVDYLPEFERAREDALTRGFAP